jgi:predicted nucleic-acid-binding Zn-ribbon protein
VTEGAPTVRLTNICPKCSRQKFAVTKKFTQPLHPATSGRTTFAAITVERGGLMGIRQELGMFEAWICLHCGFTEFYAHDLPHDIEAIIKDHADQWLVVDATPPDRGPYR